MTCQLIITYGTFTGELTGFTHELSYGTTVSGVDVGCNTWVETHDDFYRCSDNKQNDTTYANFTLGIVSKNFSL